MNTPRFQERVKESLTERSKSQSMLAEHLGISASHLSRVLNGERPLEHAMLAAIADFLDSTPEDLAVDTEVDGLARPAGAVVERETYEDLLRKLQESNQALASTESQLVAERERFSLVELDLKRCQAATEAAQDAARTSQNLTDRAREEAQQATARANRAEAAADASAGTITAREDELRRLRGELVASSKQGNQYLAVIAELRREIAGTRREAERLTEHLAAANKTIAQNYDAYLQAEAGRQALAQRLQTQQNSATTAAVFSGLIGLGAGLLGGAASGGFDAGDAPEPAKRKVRRRS